MKRIIAIIVTVIIIAVDILAFLGLFITDKTPVYGTEAIALPEMPYSPSDRPAKSVSEIPYEYSMPVPESRSVDNDFFDKCVFIGDSRMLGLVRYTDVSPVNYCSVGFSVAAYDTSKFVRVDGEVYTISEALRKNDDYTAVYIGTGLNELGWSLGRFKSKYAEMLDDIKECAGERPVYIQLIMPMTTEFETSKKMNPFGLKNENVHTFNEALIELAVEKNVYYIDCSEPFVLEDGTLNPEKSSDGAHLTLEAYAEQLEYYKNHVAEFYK